MKSRLILSILCIAFISSIFSQIPTKGLVLYLPLNGNAKDSSSYSNNGTIHGTIPVADRSGNANKAMYFNGNSYINISASASLNLTKNKSISCWVFIPSNETQNWYPTIIHKDEPIKSCTYSLYLSDYYGYSTNQYKAAFLFASNNDHYQSFTNQTYTNYKNKWLHMVGTYDSISGYSKIYFNGQISDSVYVGNKSSNSSNLDLFIGCGKNNSYYSQTFFKGGMDDIRMYNRALTPIEVIALFNEGKSVTIKDTTTYYVTNPEFKVISPISHLIQSDFLISKSTGGDSIINHYASFVYNENIKPILVTDTLIIKLNVAGIASALATENIVKIYPNPAKDYVYIDFGEYSKMQGYVVTIRDVSGKLVSSTNVNQKLLKFDLKLWSVKGTCLIQIFDNKSNLVDTRKVLLQ